MNRRHYWLSAAFAVLSSFSYMLWSWHDTTCTDCLSNPSARREQTRADRAASVGYALARVLLALALLELVPRTKDT